MVNIQTVRSWNVRRGQQVNTRIAKLQNAQPEPKEDIRIAEHFIVQLEPSELILTVKSQNAHLEQQANIQIAKNQNARKEHEDSIQIV